MEIVISGFKPPEAVPEASAVKVTVAAWLRSMYVPTYPLLLSVQPVPLAAPLDCSAKLLPSINVCAKAGEEIPPTITKHFTNRFMDPLFHHWRVARIFFKERTDSPLIAACSTSAGLKALK
jgi:hypothetical protein